MRMSGDECDGQAADTLVDWSADMYLQCACSSADPSGGGPRGITRPCPGLPPRLKKPV